MSNCPGRTYELVTVTHIDIKHTADTCRGGDLCTISLPVGINTEVYAMVSAFAEILITAVQVRQGCLIEGSLSEDDGVRNLCWRNLGILDSSWQPGGGSGADGRRGEGENDCQLHDE